LLNDWRCRKCPILRELLISSDISFSHPFFSLSLECVGLLLFLPLSQPSSSSVLPQRRIQAFIAGGKPTLSLPRVLKSQTCPQLPSRLFLSPTRDVSRGRPPRCTHRICISSRPAPSKPFAHGGSLILPAQTRSPSSSNEELIPSLLTLNSEDFKSLLLDYTSIGPSLSSHLSAFCP